MGRSRGQAAQASRRGAAIGSAEAVALSQDAYPPGPYGAKPLHRPILVALLAVVIMIVGTVVLIAGLVVALGLGILGGLVAGLGGALIGAALGAAMVIGGAVLLIAGLGLWGMRSWAWWLSVIVVVLQLLASFSLLGIGGKVVLGGLLLYLLVVRKHFNQ